MILPKSDVVVHLIVLSTSPNILTVNVFLFSAISSCPILVKRCALIVNLYSFVTAGWYGTRPAISPVVISNTIPGGSVLGVLSGLVASNVYVKSPSTACGSNTSK